MVKISGWESKTLGTLINEGKIVIQTGPFGTVLSAKEFVKYGIPVVAVREIREGYIQIFDETPCVSMETYNRLSKYNLATNDLVFARKGNVERSALIPLAKTKYFLGSDGICLRVITKNLLPQYLFYAIQSNTVRSFLIQNAYGTTMAGLNEKILSSIPLFLPVDIDEQSAIAETFSDIDRLISSLQKLIEKKKAIKQGAMQELLTGKKRLPGFSGKWTNTTLGRCFSKIVGGGTPSRAISEFWNGEIPWATVKDFATFIPYKTQEYISEAGLNHSSTHLIPKGTLITSTRMGIGKIVIYYVDVAINQDLKALFVSDDVSKEYIYHLFGMVGKIIESLGNGSTVKGIRIEQLKNLSIVLPKKNEQQAIAQVLSDMDSEIEQLEKKLAKYQQIKQGMMQELLTGRIRVV